MAWDLGQSPAPPRALADPELATCYGGPANGRQIRAGREIEWLGIFLDDIGRRIPDTDSEGVVRTLPEDPRATADDLLDDHKRWACYRRIGVRAPELHADPFADLPLPPDGTVVYRWVAERTP